jgi:hypothetical protein
MTFCQTYSEYCRWYIILFTYVIFIAILLLMNYSVLWKYAQERNKIMPPFFFKIHASFLKKKQVFYFFSEQKTKVQLRHAMKAMKANLENTNKWWGRHISKEVNCNSGDSHRYWSQTWFNTVKTYEIYRSLEMNTNIWYSVKNTCNINAKRITDANSKI